MKNRLSNFLRLLSITLVVGLLFTATNAVAQSKASVVIPFAFTANHQVIPAAYYKVELLSDRFLCFTNIKTGKHQTVLLVNPEPEAYIDTRSALQFRVSGDRYYLTEVRFAGSSMHSTPVIPASLERELAKLPSTRPIEIAMK